MADKKKLITSGKLGLDLRGGEEWFGGNVVFKPGIHRFRVSGFEEAQSREKKSPMYALVATVISGPGDSMEDVEKSIRRNFMIGSEDGLNFFRGTSKKLLGDDWRNHCDNDGDMDVEAFIGVEFDAMIDEAPYKDQKTGADKMGWTLNMSSAENATVPTKKATVRARPTR